MGMISRTPKSSDKPVKTGKTQAGAGATIIQTPNTPAIANSSQVDEVLALVGHGARRDDFLQFAERHDAGGGGEIAQQAFDHQRDHLETGGGMSGGDVRIIFGGTDQRGGECAESMRQRGQLRHRRHRHQIGERRADRRRRHERDEDPLDS